MMNMLMILLGVVLVVLSLYQFYTVRGTFKRLKSGETTSTSTFVVYGLWTGLIVAVFLLIDGIGTIIYFI